MAPSSQIPVKIDPPASEAEAAAIGAAIERFVADTSSQPAESEASLWARAAIYEATGQQPRLGPWGDGSPWGNH